MIKKQDRAADNYSPAWVMIIMIGLLLSMLLWLMVESTSIRNDHKQKLENMIEDKECKELGIGTDYKAVRNKEKMVYTCKDGEIVIY